MTTQDSKGRAVTARFTGAPPRSVRASCIVLAGLAGQGAVGYTQYFSHLPAGLVWVHVSMSAVLWILVLRLYLSTSEHGPLSAARARARPESSARNLQAPRVTLGAEEGVS